ncbi:MAG: GC-type dockerin domain-anchored protein [Phycisphaerales bacterium JB040]
MPLLTTMLAGLALAAPPLGGEMNHVTVELMPDGSFRLETERPGYMFLSEYGDGYAGAEAVLNGSHFNAQYGWLASGFWAPPFGSAVWIEAIEQDPRLSVYLGRPTSTGSYFQPIHGTAGSPVRFAWDGSMLHNYHAADVLGVFRGEYRVYIGDPAGTPLPGYTPDTIRLRWMSADFHPESLPRFEIVGDGPLEVRGHVPSGPDDGGGSARVYTSAVHTHWADQGDGSARALIGLDISSPSLAGDSLALELVGGHAWTGPDLFPAPGTVPALTPLGAGDAVTLSVNGDSVSTLDPGTLTLSQSVSAGESFDIVAQTPGQPEGRLVALEFRLIIDGLDRGESLWSVLAPDGPDPVARLHHAALYLEAHLGSDPCPGDVNRDGVLDNGDIGAFVQAFLAGDLAVDFAPDGVLDNGDISAFVVVFLAGC